MTETDTISVVKALEAFQVATAEMLAVRDTLATTLYRLTLEEHWLVPAFHRPTCPSGKPCTSWTCLTDECVFDGIEYQRPGR